MAGGRDRIQRGLGIDHVTGAIQREVNRTRIHQALKEKTGVGKGKVAAPSPEEARQFYPCGGRKRKIVQVLSLRGPKVKNSG